MRLVKSFLFAAVTMATIALPGDRADAIVECMGGCALPSPAYPPNGVVLVCERIYGEEFCRDPSGRLFPPIARSGSRHTLTLTF